MLETLTFIAVTILAFVYVPLNLATSIFGMNLSELNGSGKRLWVFLATAIIAVLIAGTSWFLLEEGNNYRNWQLRKIRITRTRFTIGARMAMLAWLWRHGHTQWAWKSGAWWRVLTDSASRMREPEENRGLTACEYVSSRDSTWEPHEIIEYANGAAPLWTTSTSGAFEAKPMV